MSHDYIFCPLCGGVKWMVDKTGSTHDGRLTLHKCTGCRKFTYTNETIVVKHEILLGVTDTQSFSVCAEIHPYIITVYYKENKTHFRNADSLRLILEINKSINFNWYRDEEVKEKIKKYLVFS